MTEQLFPEVTRNTARLPALATLDKRFTLIWGKHDPYLGSGVAEDLLPHLRDAKLNVLPAGHWPQMDTPEDVARLMLA